MGEGDVGKGVGVAGVRIVGDLISGEAEETRPLRLLSHPGSFFVVRGIS